MADNTKDLVPTNDDFARVGQFIDDQATLNLAGLIATFNQASSQDGDERDEYRIFRMLSAMAETIVQKFHLRDDPEALQQFRDDVAGFKMSAALEPNTQEDNGNDTQDN